MKITKKEQRKHFDESPLQANIYNFLEILLPTPQEWYNIELKNRKHYIDILKSLGYIGIYKRDRISVKGIMCELFGCELNQPIERKLSLKKFNCT